MAGNKDVDTQSVHQQMALSQSQGGHGQPQAHICEIIRLEAKVFLVKANKNVIVGCTFLHKSISF